MSTFFEVVFIVLNLFAFWGAIMFALGLPGFILILALYLTWMIPVIV